MKSTLNWDYTSLSASYHKRPNYPVKIIRKVMDFTGLKRGDRVCDIGAGTGNLALLLSQQGLAVQALEPNRAMFKHRLQSTRNNPLISWVKASAEDTQQASDSFDGVSFGSSFNVVDRAAALQESLRICKPGMWLMMIWNHRDLDDPLQNCIESAINKRLPNYDYGIRRQNQSEYLHATGLFSHVELIETSMTVEQSAADMLEAWRSHATLQRQAGDRFNDIVEEIETIIDQYDLKGIEVPYTSRAWVARFHKNLKLPHE